MTVITIGNTRFFKRIVRQIEVPLIYVGTVYFICSVEHLCESDSSSFVVLYLYTFIQFGKSSSQLLSKAINYKDHTFPLYITYLNKHSKYWLAPDLVPLLNPSQKPTSNVILPLRSCCSCHFLHYLRFHWSKLSDRLICWRRAAFDFMLHGSPPVLDSGTDSNTECVQCLDFFSSHP